MTNDELFRQALQRQNDRAAEMKMPDDMEQRVMERIRVKAKPRRRIFAIAINGVAASILLLLTLYYNKVDTAGTPVVAQQTEQQDSPKTAGKQELSAMTAQETPTETQPVQAEPSIPVKRHKKRTATAREVEALQTAMTESTDEQNISELQEQMEDPFLMAEMHAQQIHTRGMRLQQEIEQLVNN